MSSWAGKVTIRSPERSVNRHLDALFVCAVRVQGVKLEEIHLVLPSPDIRLDLWRDVSEIRHGDAAGTSLVVHTERIGAVRYEAVTIKRDPLSQIFITVSVDPSAFLLVGGVTRLC